MVDKIYVKPSLSYCGGKVFRKTENNLDAIAHTVLAVMAKYKFEGPEFLSKVISVY